MDPEEIGRLIKRGQQLLQAGDIAPARLMLQRAATGGSGQAAFLLGGTYDPEVLRDLGVLGFAPNTNLAREWYQRAAGTRRDRSQPPDRPVGPSATVRRQLRHSHKKREARTVENSTLGGVFRSAAVLSGTAANS